MSVCAPRPCLVLGKARRHHLTWGTGLIESCEPTHEYWESNQEPPGGQQVLSHLSNLPKNSLIKNVVGVTVLPLIVRLGCKKKKKNCILITSIKWMAPESILTGQETKILSHSMSHVKVPKTYGCSQKQFYPEFLRSSLQRGHLFKVYESKLFPSLPKRLGSNK